MSNNINKIKVKYCTNDKVQVMLSTTSNSIIFSANELLYYNDKTKEIHKYLTDYDRYFMPNHEVPKTEESTTHLFYFNDIYIHYSNNLYIERGFLKETYGYGLAFYLFKKLPDGTAIVEDHSLSDFEYSDYEYVTDADGVKKFLYMNDNENFKAILSRDGIMYACSKKDGEIVNKDKIGLSDSEVLERYNTCEEPIRSVFSYSEDGEPIPKTEEDRLKDELDVSWKKHSASDITDYSIVMHKFDVVYPKLVSIIGDDITISCFDIRYISTNKYKICEERYCVSKEKFAINDLNSFDGDSLSYLSESTKEEIPDIAIDEVTNQAPVKKLSIFQRFRRKF